MPKGINQKMVFQLTPNYMSLSSMPETKAEREQEQEHEQEQGCISCTTFNILAPIYKRLDQQVCIADYYISFIPSCNKLLWLFTMCIFGGCGTESRCSGKWFQGQMGGQEPEDFGLVALWIVFHHMSPGGSSVFLYSHTPKVSFLLDFCLPNCTIFKGHA